jgi:hypothetical protein
MTFESAAFDPEQEEPIPLADLGKTVGRKLPYVTVLRWVREGRVNQYTKKRYFLETVCMPSGYASSKEAYWRFIKQLNTLD